MTANDIKKMRDELSIAAVLDLRSPSEFEHRWEVNLLQEIGARYYNIPYRPDSSSYTVEEKELYTKSTNMGEIYLSRIRDKSFGKRVVESLEVIAGSGNRPLLFYCGAGKDRAGILSAFLLSILGVAEKDIIKDYTLTAFSIEEIRKRVNNDPAAPEDIKKLPEFAWKAAPESMALFLAALESEYGSVQDYLEAQGAAPSLFGRLRAALLV
jgi:protein-tyrosine phosphatase